MLFRFKYHETIINLDFLVAISCTENKDLKIWTMIIRFSENVSEIEFKFDDPKELNEVNIELIKAWTDYLKILSRNR